MVWTRIENLLAEFSDLPTDACHIWSRNAGTKKIWSPDGRQLAPHTAVWEYHHGAAPTSRERITWTCHNRWCVNIRHMHASPWNPRNLMTWEPETDALMESLVHAGKTAAEISQIVSRTVGSVIHRLRKLGLQAVSPDSIRPPPKKWPSGARFDNVTRLEAAVISEGAPACGWFTRHEPYSLTGNAAAMCAGVGK